MYRVTRKRWIRLVGETSSYHPKYWRLTTNRQ